MTRSESLRSVGLALSIALLAGQAVGSTSSTRSQSTPDALHQSVRMFAEAVVIPAHQRLVSTSAALARSAEAFERSPAPAEFEAFHEEWLSTVEVLAQGRAFAFGPIHSLGHDVALDSPTDPDSVALTIEQLENRSAEQIEQLPLRGSLTGLQTIGALLRGHDRPQAFTVTERRYLTALSRRVHRTSTALLDVWRTGHDGHPAFATVLASSGEPGNRAYRSVASGAEEILRGVLNTLDVVVNEELPELHSTLGTQDDSDTSSSLAALRGTLDGISTTYHDTRMNTWFDASTRSAGRTITRFLADASDAVESLAIDPQGLPRARSAITDARVSLEHAMVLLETHAMPQTRRPNVSAP